MSIWGSIPIIGNLVEKVGDAVDKNVTSDEERLKLKSELTALYIPLLTAILEAQKSTNELQAKLAGIEAASDSWLVKNRRPVIAIVSILNLVAIVPIFHTMSEDTALYIAMLVNGLDTGTRGIEKIATVLKSKDKI